MAETEMQAAKAAFPDKEWGLDFDDADRQLVEDFQSFYDKSQVTKYEFKIAIALGKNRSTLDGKILLKERLLRYTSELGSTVKRPWDTVMFEPYADFIKMLLKELQDVGKDKKKKKAEGEDAQEKDKKKDKKDKKKKDKDDDATSTPAVVGKTPSKRKK